MRFPCCSVNHRLPSGPEVISAGKPPDVGTGNSVTVPVMVIRPILLTPASVNQRLLSGPTAIPATSCVTPVGSSVIVPDGVIRPILPELYSTNQTFPAGPATIPNGSELAVGTGYSVIVPEASFRAHRKPISELRKYPE